MDEQALVDHFLKQPPDDHAPDCQARDRSDPVDEACSCGACGKNLDRSSAKAVVLLTGHGPAFFRDDTEDSSSDSSSS